MGKSKKGRPSLSRFARMSRRARGLIVLTVFIALVCFICLPLIYNGYLFAPPVPDEVYAATPAPTPTAEPAKAEETPATETDATALMAETGEPMDTPAPLSVEYTALRPEDEDPAVAVLQERLMELGFFDFDMTTDYYGSVTQSAVQLFQRTQGLEETGIADSETQSLLYGGNALPYHMKLGDRGSDVRGLQRQLNELGYYEEKDNGYFGIATESAVKAFQARNALDETGIIDKEGRDLLYSPNARPLVDPTPTPTAKATKSPSATPKPSSTPKPTYDIPEITADAVDVSTPKPTKTASSSSNDVPAGSYGSGVSGLIAAAKAQLGKPYIYSDEGPDSYDCSGLVYYSLRQAGVSVGRYSSASYSEYSAWTPIYSLSECRAGDLLFYKSDSNSNVNHTGIYLGDGTFIHASSSAGKVKISSCTDYYQRNFVIARRVF